MAFVSYVDLDPAQEEQFFHGLTPDSRFLYSKVKKKTGLFSAKKKKTLALRSLLPQISELWAGLSAGQKLDTSSKWRGQASSCGASHPRLCPL